MDRFARIVIGYHGCTTDEGVDFVRQLLDGTARIRDWRPSANDYDWLVHGIYFWEHAPARALQWSGRHETVVGAVIQLGRCLDLTDVRYTALLREAYQDLCELYESAGRALPQNRGRDLKLRELDCLVVNELMERIDRASLEAGDPAIRYQTIRCPFEEGGEAFPGSMLRTETHIQIAVRDPDCILGVFRPNLESEGAV